MCKHLNVVITEFGGSYFQHIFEGGRAVDHSVGTTDLTGMCSAQCLDCGRERRFNRAKADRLPQWLRERLAGLEAATA